MSGQHTLGRLSYCHDGHGGISINNPDEVQIAFVRRANEDNARRLVAAWNACKGIPTARLEAGAADILAHSIEPTKQRDELLDLLHIVLPYIEDAERDPAYKPGAVAKTTARLRAAIAKATWSEA